MPKPARVGKAVADALSRGALQVDLSKLPNSIDINAKSITDMVIAINAQSDNARVKFIFEKMVRHTHDFVREVGLTSDEWMNAIEYLTRVGQICTSQRQEFILLSDVLGVSTLVNAMNHPVPPDSKATEATVLGPFFVEESQDIPLGGSISTAGKGEPMFVTGMVRNQRGDGIPQCTIDTWEADEDGFYDTQYENFSSPDCRGRIVTAPDGAYSYWGVRPVAYPIPADGPVGELLKTLGRHVFRPAHVHMKLSAPGYEPLTTALYIQDDVYLTSDAVFGVKSSLVCNLELVESHEGPSDKRNPQRQPFWKLTRDIVLLTVEEAQEAKAQASFV